MVVSNKIRRGQGKCIALDTSGFWDVCDRRVVPKQSDYRLDGKRMKAAMDAAGLGDKSLADRLGTGRMQVWNWRSQVNMPAGEFMDGLSRELSVPTGYLMGRPVEVVRAEIAAMVRHGLGAEEAAAVEAFAKLQGDQRTRLAQNIATWVDGLVAGQVVSSSPVKDPASPAAKPLTLDNYQTGRLEGIKAREPGPMRSTESRGSKKPIPPQPGETKQPGRRKG